MKTRREFIKSTLGMCACIGAAVWAPRMLVAEEEVLEDKIGETKHVQNEQNIQEYVWIDGSYSYTITWSTNSND